MKILYDYQAFNQHHGGVSRYHVELIKNLRQIGIECSVPFLFSENVYLDEIHVSHIDLFSKWNNSLKRNGMKWFNQRVCLHAMSHQKYDIFHPTFLNPYYIGQSKGKPVVQTMHDLNHEKFALYKVENIIEKRRKVLADATHIIAISEQTKRDLMEIHGVDEKRITVVYHGIGQNIYSTVAHRLFERPYLLYVGGRSGYKNFGTFLCGFARLKEEIDLVCTGMLFNTEERQLISDLRLTNRIHQRFVTNEQMNQLMAQAVAFVYPSRAEGFGMPILEAFRCGCPCIISDIPCFHEVAGQAARYFNPNEIEDIASTLESVMNDGKTLSELIQSGFERMKLFSWERTAKETLKVYQSVL